MGERGGESERVAESLTMSEIPKVRPALLDAVVDLIGEFFEEANREMAFSQGAEWGHDE